MVTAAIIQAACRQGFQGTGANPGHRVTMTSVPETHSVWSLTGPEVKKKGWSRKCLGGLEDNLTRNPENCFNDSEQSDSSSKTQKTQKICKLWFPKSEMTQSEIFLGIAFRF